LFWAWSAPTAHAFSYEDEDLLLVFRKPGFNDVEFNLGTVSNLLSRAEGSVTRITGWDPALVETQYELTDGVEFILIATTGSQAPVKRVWITSADADAVVQDRTPSQWKNLWSKIDGVGRKPLIYAGTDSSHSYVVAPDHISSYSYITANGGVQPAAIPTLGGQTSFSVEQSIPGTSIFYEVQTSTVVPKPAARRVGAFAFAESGELTFTAGSGIAQPPSATEIVGIQSQDGSVVVSFKTETGVHYRLRGADSLASSRDTWAAIAGSVTGTGGVLSLQDQPAGPGPRFYVVEAYR
jgi:hypothetical protein